MKLSRRGKRTKRAKCTKRTKNIKCRRNTKRHLNKYKRKNTYRKHSHKLRKNKRVMRGGVYIPDLLDESKNQTVNLRYKKGESVFSDTGYFELSGGIFSTEKPEQNNCFGKEYYITFTLTRQKGNKNFTISFKVVYEMGLNLRKLTISTLNPININENENKYEKFCTVTKTVTKEIGRTNKLSTGTRSAISDLKLVSDVSDGNEVYTFPVSSTRNKIFFENLVIHISKKFDVCESESLQQEEYRPYDVKNIKRPDEVVGAYLGDQDPEYKKWRE